MKASWLALCALACAGPVAAAESRAAAPPIYLQAWLGGLGTSSDSWQATDSNNDSVLGDLGTLPFGGGAGQKLWGTDAWKIGFEGGALGTWKSDNTQFRGVSSGGTTVQVTVDSKYFSIGIFMGGVVSVNLSRYVRLYVAGGPSATWAWVDDDGGNNDTAGNTVDLSNSDSDGSFVAYGRAGIEFALNSGFTFGASVRYADDDFSFGKAGDLKLDEPLYLLTLGAVLP
jgi:hypothetical protein